LYKIKNYLNTLKALQFIARFSLGDIVVSTVAQLFHQQLLRNGIAAQRVNTRLIQVVAVVSQLRMIVSVLDITDITATVVLHFGVFDCISYHPAIIKLLHNTVIIAS